MLDVKLLRSDPDRVRRGLAAKGATADLDWFLQQDREFRSVVHELETARARQKELSRAIGAKRKAGGDAEAERAEVQELKAKEKMLAERHGVLKEDLRKLLMALPNLPAEGVPVGRGEDENVVVSSWSEPEQPDFEPKPHWELASALGCFDARAAAELAGSGFSLLTGGVAQLERALSSYMLDLHTREHGYTEVSPPFVVRGKCLEGTGQLPKFASDMYRCEGDDLWLVPTAEVPLTNIQRGRVLDVAELPLRYTALSPCWRREAGAAGKDTRGIIRMHQFLKVELMSYCTPDQSAAELNRIREHAETVLRNLNLPYRVVELCTGDMTFAAERTLDLEVWAAGLGRWLEVSSVSIFGTFQARRASIRFRQPGAKPEHVHTLNGSALALPRTLIAVLENYQREDGSIVVPDVLRPYMGWRTEIR